MNIKKAEHQFGFFVASLNYSVFAFFGLAAAFGFASALGLAAAFAGLAAALGATAFFTEAKVAGASPFNALIAAVKRLLWRAALFL